MHLKISECDICSGPGIRVVIYVTDIGELYTEDIQNNLLELLRKEEYIDGITFTGDTLHDDNVKEICNLICKIRQFFPHKTIWLCSDYCFESVINSDLSANIKENDEENSIIKYRQKAILNSDVFVDRQFIKSHKDILSALDCHDSQSIIDIRDYLKLMK